MKSVNRVAALALSVALVGCANLKEVSNFASESAKFSAYTELTTRYRDTYERERPYFPGPKAEADAKVTDEQRKHAYQDLLKIHQAVGVYMKTLAVLAGDTTFDLSKEMKSLSAGIKPHPVGRITEKHVGAFSRITKIVTSAYQHKAVREMLKDGDPHLQILLDGMMTLVDIYQETHNGEKMEFEKLEVRIHLTEKRIGTRDETKNDKLLALLAKAHLQAKQQEYQLASVKYTAAKKGIAHIKSGHKALLENVDKLSSAEAKSLILKFSDDIKAIRDTLRAL